MGEQRVCVGVQCCPGFLASGGVPDVTPVLEGGHTAQPRAEGVWGELSPFSPTWPLPRNLLGVCGCRGKRHSPKAA